MNIEEILIHKWRLLPPEKQAEVIDFISFLEQKYSEEQKQLGKKSNLLNSLEGTLTYYEDPYKPVAINDWEAMM
ncbi:hypothetical protein Cyast_2238 [Cyanobacterium stanieri PCC 7202]|uniref:DUF2281 domain-containing protein n=1 Tax=Cyanobacterium stanieri (strain ATCC 29140 / PCC 7202) TaxID=292563 RepID=K9YP22_CYASC|nr:hypothetical protein Cyast_2238 [Cyanobacterium stanieri PCC 7202]